jgi:hypothetical protein
MGLLAFGVGVGLGISVYRNVPAVLEPAWSVVLVVWVGSMLAAYFGGRGFVQKQWQMQIQEQEQQQGQIQEQGQQQAVVIQVMDRDQAAAVAGGVPAEAGDPATLGSLGNLCVPKVSNGFLEIESRAHDSHAVPEVGGRPVPEVSLCDRDEVISAESQRDHAINSDRG